MLTGPRTVTLSLKTTVHAPEGYVKWPMQGNSVIKAFVNTSDMKLVQRFSRGFSTNFQAGIVILTAADETTLVPPYQKKKTELCIIDLTFFVSGASGNGTIGNNFSIVLYEDV